MKLLQTLNYWDGKRKLQELLRRPQGVAWDFVSDQLPKKYLNNYRKITKELQNRFGVYETTKNYKVLFTRRNQKFGETHKACAAELKRIYDKAYSNRDMKIRQEDLLQRFLMGLADNKTRFHNELYKDLNSIEEALQDAITYLETTDGPAQEGQTGQKFKRQVRQVKKNEDPKFRVNGIINGKKPIEQDNQSRVLMLVTKSLPEHKLKKYKN